MTLNRSCTICDDHVSRVGGFHNEAEDITPEWAQQAKMFMPCVSNI